MSEEKSLYSVLCGITRKSQKNIELESVGEGKIFFDLHCRYWFILTSKSLDFYFFFLAQSIFIEKLQT